MSFLTPPLCSSYTNPSCDCDLVHGLLLSYPHPPPRTVSPFCTPHLLPPTLFTLKIHSYNRIVDTAHASHHIQLYLFLCLSVYLIIHLHPNHCTRYNSQLILAPSYPRHAPPPHAQITTIPPCTYFAYHDATTSLIGCEQPHPIAGI